MSLRDLSKAPKIFKSRGAPAIEPEVLESPPLPVKRLEEPSELTDRGEPASDTMSNVEEADISGQEAGLDEVIERPGPCSTETFEVAETEC